MGKGNTLKDDWYCQACSAQLRVLNGGKKKTDIKPKKNEWWGSTMECCLCEQKPKKVEMGPSNGCRKKGGEKEAVLSCIMCAVCF
eukprot:TRINITY_DN1072_c0_g1_i1.p3 TRINITY_DN1072_c0_g1~~TRINITY_DN1072_c0_g1_i1.p3  ORF type:complete len:85 (-),score=9.16 TRINITY_DN1072_c0_g1_i1:517-771(-)